MGCTQSSSTSSEFKPADFGTKEGGKTDNSNNNKPPQVYRNYEPTSHQKTNNGSIKNNLQDSDVESVASDEVHQLSQTAASNSSQKNKTEVVATLSSKNSSKKFTSSKSPAKESQTISPSETSTIKTISDSRQKSDHVRKSISKQQSNSDEYLADNKEELIPNAVISKSNSHQNTSFKSKDEKLTERGKSHQDDYHTPIRKSENSNNNLNNNNNHHHHVINRKDSPPPPVISAVVSGLTNTSSSSLSPVPSSRAVNRPSSPSSDKEEDDIDTPMTFAKQQTKIHAILKIQRSFRRRKYWKSVMEEREWKIFSDLDTQDEADMLNLASFMQTLLDNCDKSNSVEDIFDDLEVLSDTSNTSATSTASSKSADKLRNVVVQTSSKPLFSEKLDSYDLPKGPLNSKVAADIISLYKNNGYLSLKSIQKILRHSYKYLKKLKTISEINIEKGDKITIVGDLHGQLGDLFHILDESGWPSPTNKYIFNGDFVDRGEQGVEVVCVLFSLFAAMPDCVFMNRGNHEDHPICCVYGFEKEVKKKYDDLTFGMFVEMFRYIPLFAIINKEVFVVHGGLFHDVNVKLSDLAEIERSDYCAKPSTPYPECCDGLDEISCRKEYLKQLQRDALWSDPNEFEVLSQSSRGSGVMFGPEVTRRFLKNNNLNMVVRSHECVRRGFDQPFKGAFKNLLCTVFSASHYCGGQNDASYLTFSCHDVSGSTAVSNSKCNMQFQVHQFNLYDATESLKASNQDNIRELIVRKSKALKQAFQTADITCSKKLTKLQWSEIMQSVTKLKILWLSILKDISPECIDGNIIDYSVFLQSLKKSVDSSITVDVLYAGQRQKLEAIFSFFDKNGDGTISREEFKKGCDFMNKTLPPDEQLRDYDHILNLMDFDHSNSIDINEFFETFRILDAKDGTVDGILSLAAKK